MVLFFDFLIAAAVFVVWYVVQAILFRIPLRQDRRISVVVGSIAFVFIAVFLQAQGVTPDRIAAEMRGMVTGIGLRLDQLVSWIGGLLGQTWSTSISFILGNFWDQVRSWISYPMTLGGGSFQTDAAYFVNLMMVLVYFVVRFVLWAVMALAFRLVSVARKTMSTPEEEGNEYPDGTTSKEEVTFEEPGARWWLDNRTVRQATLWLYRISAAVLGICLLTFAWDALTGGLRTADAFNAFREQAVFFYWAGLIILAGELTNAVRVPRTIDRWLDRFLKRGRGDDAVDDLKALYTHYISTFSGQRWLRNVEFVPNKATESDDVEDSPHTATAGNESYSSYDPARTLSHLKIGTLNATDFELIVNMIGATKDKAGSTLILCPPRHLEDLGTEESNQDDVAQLLRDTIREIMGSTVFDLTQHVHFLRERHSATHLAYDLIIGTEFELADALSDLDASVQDALERVQSIVIVEFHRLDMGVLTLQLQRLRLLTGDVRLSVYCQSDDRQNLQDTLGNVFPDTAIDAFAPNRLLDNKKNRRFWLLWSHKQGLFEKLLKFADLKPEAAPLNEPMPLLMLSAFLNKIAFSIYDPLGGVYVHDWRVKWADKISDRAAPKVRKFAQFLKERIHPQSMFQSGNIPQVIFQEDSCNVYDAIQRYRGLEHDGDTMIHIVSGWYPTRDYLYDQLGLETIRPHEDIMVVDGLKPIQPVPIHSVKQVALELYGALVPNRRVSERQVQDIMITRPRDDTARLLNALGATPSIRGIEMLFERVLGFRAPIERVIDDDTREGFFHFSAIQNTSNFYLAPVVWANEGKTITSMLTGDYGLTYSKDTFLQFGRNMFIVEDVEVTREPLLVESVIKVRRQDYSGGAFKARPLSRFCRSYYPLNEHQRLADSAYISEIIDYPTIIIEKGANTLPSIGSTARRLVHMSFERETFASYTHEHNVPFTKTSKVTYSPIEYSDLPSTETGAQIHRIHQPTLVVSRVLSPDAASGKTKPDRGKSAFTLAATLNELIATLFPKEAHRVAVVSPQATVRHPKLRRANAVTSLQQERDLDVYIDLVYPQYFTNKPQQTEDRLPTHWSSQFGEVFGDGRLQSDSAISNPGPEKFQPGNLQIDLLILEDASLDLGVVRALDTNWAMVEVQWLNYLEWLCKMHGSDNPYAFGGNTIPDLFDFESALSWLKN